MKYVLVSLMFFWVAFASDLQFVERATSDVVTDIRATGDSVGDILTFANKVYDATNAKKVGTDSSYCIRTIVGQQWDCYWTLYLEGGQIVVHGPFYDAVDSVLAIIGGTGDFAGASGR